MPTIDLSYPIGKFLKPLTIDATARARFVDQIAETPALIRQAVEHLNDRQLDTPYRPGGWTIRQVVHHVPDSHMNAYLRFKFALTEEEPLIKPYNEADWARLPEALGGPIHYSLDLLQSLHERWVACIHQLTTDRFKRTFRHPEIGIVTLDEQLAMYAWHGRHHTAHITSLLAREGWTHRQATGA
ncbi:MAG: putative metal-dependent hydrolase [candidate division Zixibacteria bacterium]|nr:putative metal-dependent hydrolase [candidate division Zixibacteria bacterium]